MTGARAPEPPLVSIVVPSFNQGSFIGDAIDSVIAQDYPSIEVVVVDGCSSDDTVDVLHRYDGDHRVRWTSEPDRGQSDAINKGWRRSRGEILSWLCADDALSPTAVSRVVDAFREHPEAGFVYGRGDIVDLEGKVLHTTPLGQRDAWELVHHQNYICQPAAFARREALDSVGEVDVSLEYAMDWDLFIRLARAVPMVHVPEVLACVRTYEGTKSIRGGHRRFREIVKVLRRYAQRRYPPSYFVFCCHAYEVVARDLIDRAPTSLEPLKRRAHRGVGMVTTSLNGRLQRRIGADNGWYQDGWAAPSVGRTLPGAWRSLRIRGCLPGEYEPLRGQELAIWVDGTLVGRESLQAGEFTVEVPLEAVPTRSVHRMRIEACKWFVPRRLGINQDRRRLSFRLTDLDGSDD